MKKTIFTHIVCLLIFCALCSCEFMKTAPTGTPDSENLDETPSNETPSDETPDTEAPVISNIQVVHIMGDRVTVSWDTDEPATSAVSYWGEGVPEKKQTTDTIYSINHSVRVLNLQRATQYRFSVRSSDSSGNEAVSKESGFETASAISYDVEFKIDVNDASSISEYVYGANIIKWWNEAPFTFGRIGGNRRTCYNWENNGMHAGSDYNYQNDSVGGAPGEKVTGEIDVIQSTGKSALVTIPIIDYVASKNSGEGVDVNTVSGYLTKLFDNNNAKKPSAAGPLSLIPDLADGEVYQEEFVNFLYTEYPDLVTEPDKKIFFSLDNEPDLWYDTHERVHPEKVTYEEIKSKTIEYASMIKDMIPESTVFGLVSYGFYGYVSLQDAPDAAERDFLPWYLGELRAESDSQNRRLVDVLDLHYYSEVRLNSRSNITDPVQIQKVVQSPRSLWDPDYSEDSWIDGWIDGDNGVWAGENIQMIPRLKGIIEENNPGTKIAFTEYNFYGGDTIAGGIAQADALGIFGREGIFAANIWYMVTPHPYIYGAFYCYLDYDGNGSGFGDMALQIENSDHVKTSAYASRFGSDYGKIVLVVINKMPESNTALIDLNSNPETLHSAKIYVMDSNHDRPVYSTTMSVVDNEMVYSMPPYSVSVLELMK